MSSKNARFRRTRSPPPEPAMRSAVDAAVSPKYALVERERRWLVNAGQHPSLDRLPHVLIEDRYITGSLLRLRRMTDAASGRVSLKLTKKYPASDQRARPIVTAYLDEAEYRLFSTLPAQPLAKRRYALSATDGGFSLDVFLGALDSLVTIEKECPDAATLLALTPPAWAGFEVTDDIRYSGGSLAANGLPETET
jgi:CYTH domain-containing protein